MSDRASREGAALWLGGLATAALAFALFVHFGPAVASLIRGAPPEPDCHAPPRFAEWRMAFRSIEGDQDLSLERTRRHAAAYLMKCRTLHGASRATVKARLGRGLSPEGTRAEHRRYLEYYLGPDGLGIDSETLMFEFDGHGRLARIDVVQG